MGRPRKPADTTPDEQEAIELSEILRTIGDDNVIVKLFRVDAQGRQKFKEVLPRETIENGTIEMAIQEQYPEGGTFIIRVLQGGKFIKGGNKTIHIEALAGASVAYGGSYGEDFHSSQVSMMKMQLDMQNKADERMMAMMQNQNTSMMQLLTAIMANNRPMDPLALAQLLQSGGGGGSLGTLKDAIAIVTELKGDGGGGKDDPMTAIATSAVNRLIDKTMGGGIPQPAARPPQQLPPATHQPTTNPPAATQPAAGPEDMPNPELAERMQLLADLKLVVASSKSADDVDDDVELWAEFIERMAPLKPACRWILDVVKAYPWDVVQAGLVRVDHEISTEPYAAFFAKLHERLATGPQPEAQ